jgi:membrane protein involved in colicin uptake
MASLAMEERIEKLEGELAEVKGRLLALEAAQPKAKAKAKAEAKAKAKVEPKAKPKADAKAKAKAEAKTKRKATDQAPEVFDAAHFERYDGFWAHYVVKNTAEPES